MANKNLLTNAAKLTLTEIIYFSPSVTIPSDDANLISWYCFLSKVDSWPDNQNPPEPKQDQRSIKDIFNNMFVAKHILSNNISPVIRRTDWSSGTVYDYYLDDVDILAVDENGYNVYNYYVKNKYDQVFKCLWNNNGSESTVEPYFQPGSYGTNNIFSGADGYKWKYIYSIDLGSKLKFMDSTWMPVPVLTKAPDPTQSQYGTGSIEVINVTNTGNNYYSTNSIVSVTISGDGVGANASPVITGGHITDIIVTDPGSNYSYANVSITATPLVSGGPVGSGAVAFAPSSPVGGHGSYPISELGCTHVMMTCEFEGDEMRDGVKYIPTEIDFYQLGLIVNPTTKSLSPQPANGEIYKTTTDLIFAPGLDTFDLDEIVYQGKSLAAATFKGKVLYFDSSTNVLHLINTVGTLTVNASVYGNTSKTSRTLLGYTEPEFVAHSGYLTYIENRSSVQRSPDGIEQIKIVLGY